MIRILRLIYFVTALTCLNVCILYPLKAQNSVTDTTVERLMKQNNYAETTKLISPSWKTIPISVLIINCIRTTSLVLLNCVCGILIQPLFVPGLPLYFQKNQKILQAAYSFNNVGKLDSALFYTQKMMQYGERNGDANGGENNFYNSEYLLYCRQSSAHQ